MSPAPEITPADVKAIGDAYDRLAPIVLRDYFAAKAMELVFPSCAERDFNVVARRVAAGAYIMADAMLAARQPKAVQG